MPGTADIRSEVEVRDVAEQPMLLIREHAALDELSEVIPRAIDEVHAHMQAAGAAFAGPPVVLYPAMHDDGTVDLETGWPVERPASGGGRVEYATVPGGTMLVHTHRGPYDELNRAHRALWELIEREGLTVDGAAREVYLTDPAEVSDPADWVTEIQLPIVRDEARIAALAGAAS